MDPKEIRPNGNAHVTSADEFVVIVYDDGPGDTTVRPAGPEIPRDWPRPQPPRQPLPSDRR